MKAHDEFRIRAIVHSGLRETFSRIAGQQDWAHLHVDYQEPELMLANAADLTPVVLPAVDDSQARFVIQLRNARILTPILTIVNDLDGYQTCRAMVSGATSVLNLELPRNKQRMIIQSFLGFEDEPSVVNMESIGGGESGQLAAEPPSMDADEIFLIDLLCGQVTIATIARMSYCSERSMYRRVRELYTKMGVSSRAELRARAASVGPRCRSVKRVSHVD